MTDRPAARRRPLVVPEPEMTIAEVASQLGITPCRVRQLEAKALSKLRRQLHKRGYQLSDFFD